MENTPGYNVRISIKLTTDRAGRPRAQYWSMRMLRWFPIAREKAEFFLATGAADRAAS